jgi:uncharacterized protein GlcG (DUF336 family)
VPQVHWTNRIDVGTRRRRRGQQGAIDELAGGLIFFGGGVSIYRRGEITGGLGVSGDTSCADHEIASRCARSAD